MLELKMTLEGDEEKAFLFMVAQINENSAVKYDAQEIFRQQGIYYIRRALEDYTPIRIASENLESLSDEQALELTAKVINNYDDFVANLDLSTVPKENVFLSLLKAIKEKITP